MTIAIAPKEALASPNPAIGIFWRIGNVLLVDRRTLADAEIYGDCMTHPIGHYERWEGWRALSGTQRARVGIPDCIVSTEYDQWPRGRVVLEMPAYKFVIYADLRLRQGSMPETIKTAFGLGGFAVDVRGDAHYRTSPEWYGAS